MRKVILEVAISLDGFIEGPKGEYDWCFTDQDYGQQDFFEHIDAVFVGGKTYQLLLSLGDAGTAGFPAFTYYVFSTTLDAVKDGDILIKGNIAEEVSRIKNSPGKDIWLFGGASLTTSLMNEGLVDEISLAVHPILLGSGKPLFSNIKGRVSLELIGSKTYPTGLASITYKILKRETPMTGMTSF
jgi:dihydrofolate reductase